MKAYLINMHLLVSRSRSSAKVRVKYKGYISQKMAVSGAFMFHKHILLSLMSDNSHKNSWIKISFGSEIHETSYETSNYALYLICQFLGSSSSAANKDIMSKIWTSGETSIWPSRKHCGKRRNCLLPAISPFPTMFSKALLMCQNEYLWSKELTETCKDCS